MNAPAALSALEPELAALPGAVSVWCGPVGGPSVLEREADRPHYAASTMKVAVLAALYRAADEGRLTLDAEVAVHNDFASAAGGGRRFAVDESEDSDPPVWARIGGVATLRWLARRMVIRSSNLATNLVLEHVGAPAADQVWRLAGAARATVTRGIDDAAARAAGLHNLVTAADLTRLFGALAQGRLASTDATAEMLDVLAAQEYGEHLAAGLPAGVRVAHKDGWDTRVRHAAGLIWPPDAAPYLLAICTTEAAPDDAAAGALITRISAAAWADRR